MTVIVVTHILNNSEFYALNGYIVCELYLNKVVIFKESTLRIFFLEKKL